MFLEGAADTVGIESYLLYLFCQRGNIGGVGVSDGYYGMTAVKVQVLGTFTVPYPAAGCPLRGNVEQGIYVKEFHVRRRMI